MSDPLTYEGNIDFVTLSLLSASSSTRTMLCQTVAAGQTGNDNDAERFDSVEVVQPSGLAAAPTLTSTTEGLQVRRGEEAVVIAVIDKGASPQTVESGETRLYGVGSNNAASNVRLRASGQVEVNAGNSANVVLNGGSLNVARASDPVTASGTAVPPAGLLGWMTQVTAALNALVPGSVTVPVPTTIGTISGGNPTVKA